MYRRGCDYLFLAENKYTFMISPGAVSIVSLHHLQTHMSIYADRTGAACYFPQTIVGRFFVRPWLELLLMEWKKWAAVCAGKLFCERTIAHHHHSASRICRRWFVYCTESLSATLQMRRSICFPYRVRLPDDNKPQIRIALYVETHTVDFGKIPERIYSVLPPVQKNN